MVRDASDASDSAKLATAKQNVLAQDETIMHYENGKQNGLNSFID